MPVQRPRGSIGDKPEYAHLPIPRDGKPKPPPPPSIRIQTAWCDGARNEVLFFLAAYGVVVAGLLVAMLMDWL